MNTIDMNQVAGLQAVDAEGNVIGTLSVDDLTNLVANNLVKSTQNQVAAQSVSTLSDATTLAASDEYENTLPVDDNPKSVRTLDAAGNPKQTGINALATVVGGLLNNKTFINTIGAIRKLEINSYTDLNDIEEISFGQFLSDTINMPVNIGGFVLTICSSSKKRLQLYVEESSVYIRPYFDTKWHNWMKIFG